MRPLRTYLGLYMVLLPRGRLSGRPSPAEASDGGAFRLPVRESRTASPSSSGLGALLRGQLLRADYWSFSHVRRRLDNFTIADPRRLKDSVAFIELVGE